MRPRASTEGLWTWVGVLGFKESRNLEWILRICCVFRWIWHFHNKNTRKFRSVILLEQGNATKLKYCELCRLGRCIKNPGSTKTKSQSSLKARANSVFGHLVKRVQYFFRLVGVRCSACGCVGGRAQAEHSLDCSDAIVFVCLVVKFPQTRSASLIAFLIDSRLAAKCYQGARTQAPSQSKPC